MSFSAYPAYKDSGVEWLGKTPQHWSVYSLKRTVDGCVNGLWGDEPDGENDIAVIRVADFQRSSSTVGLDKLTYRSITTKERQSRLIKSGDLLIEKSGGGEKTLVGCVVLFAHDFDAITSNFVARMRPLADFDSQFLCYAFGNLYDGRVNYPSVKQVTGIQNLDAESYLQERFCFPTRAEQTHIARFLDHETARIDALIEEQHRLIALLKEKRQAVISHAVTKGLDPTVPMKDSGVEWLGKVPAHWVVSRVKNIASFITSGPRGWSDYIDEAGEDTFLQSGDMDNRLNVLFNKAKRIRTPEGAEGVRTRLQDGDVVVCITGANTGRVAVLETVGQAAYVNQHLGLIRPDLLACKSRYLGYALSSSACQTYFNVEQYGLKEGLSLTHIAEAPLMVPPLAEQVKLIEALENQLGNLDGLTADSEMTVELLQERRSALISAAVTGKIDVRGWKPPTSALSPELEEEAV
ncbi:restriction endonuclease subunit S [Pseudomonas sp. W5-01]|uniref:restriction endonuclease subunit S n=1 Tax=Pseudomonas sp. W5-01 TaxID=3097454 RepID=UPI0010EB5A3B|nr:MAG: restriction endonuclease subunit S [Oxalobacteraceae bacterium]